MSAVLFKVDDNTYIKIDRYTHIRDFSTTKIHRLQPIAPCCVIGRRRKTTGTGFIYWVCLCDCGTKTIVDAGSLAFQGIKSCGCLHREESSKRMKAMGPPLRSHNLRSNPLYSRWADMNNRCYREKDNGFKNYGGRGIQVAEVWRKDNPDGCKNFIDYIENVLGLPPSKNYTIDRINNDGDYKPGNIQWATRTQQSENRRNNHWITHPRTGETLSQSGWARKLNGYPALVRDRIRRGWDLERALDTPHQNT